MGLFIEESVDCWSIVFYLSRLNHRPRVGPQTAAALLGQLWYAHNYVGHWRKAWSMLRVQVNECYMIRVCKGRENLHAKCLTSKADDCNQWQFIRGISEEKFGFFIWKQTLEQVHILDWPKSFQEIGLSGEIRLKKVLRKLRSRAIFWSNLF